MDLRLEPTMKLGEILIKQGILTPFRVQATLYMQAGSDKRFGEMLIELGEATTEEVNLALLEQRQHHTLEGREGTD